MCPARLAFLEILEALRDRLGQDLMFDESAKYSTSHVRYEFRRQASQVNRKDFRAIEYKIRHGYKQIKLLKMPGVINFRSW